MWPAIQMIEQDFKEATEAFGDFLVSQGCSRAIAWVFREGITQHRRRWLLDVNATESGVLATDAEALYEEGRRRGLGVRFNAIGEAGGVTYAYVWVPEDEGEADAMMMTGGLRCSVSTGGVIVTLTQRRWWFEAVRFVDELRGGGTFVKDVPRRPRSALVSASGAT